ncbi:hypothetical protein E1298_09265 [Actinomadura rubrisoli]|uniref:Uncharacterized protein n=1 Tax=Actinomadura rubrisoli TaxID=2530368 RepID=A0A4V6PF65_9ACTN|nr:hypothetical protein E1298_09265 [Actinomadura rubrisoli]
MRLDQRGDPVSRNPQVRNAAERVAALVREGAQPQSLLAALDELDDELLDAGSRSTSRSMIDVPGVPPRPEHEVLCCPGPSPCSRVEEPRWPRRAPLCRIHGERLRRTALQSDE